MAGFTLDELVSKFRTEMDDVVQPYLWTDDEIIDFLDEAQTEFAMHTEIFKERGVAITVTAANPYVTLPEGLIRVRRATLATNRDTPLGLRNFNEMDTLMSSDDYGRVISNWESETGIPAFLVLDDTQGEGRLAPIPDADDSLELSYSRLPLKPLTATSQTTELTDRRHQRSLLVFARARAYNKHDSDMYDPRMSQGLLQQFMTEIERFRIENTKLTRKPGVVRYGGY
jgi:hypothetical protein